MQRGNKVTLSGKKRIEMLVCASCYAQQKVGTFLQDADAPKAFAAYKRLMKSLDMTIKHAMRKHIRESPPESPVASEADLTGH
jgi:hypothetical protein